MTDGMSNAIHIVLIYDLVYNVVFSSAHIVWKARTIRKRQIVKWTYLQEGSRNLL